MQWSTYMQNPRFLEMSRKFMLNQDLKPLVINYIGIIPGMKVLDVGCGTGAFTRYIAEGCRGANFIGLDNDEKFLKEANNLARQKNLLECIEFVYGDAKKIPFKDNSFDIVVSNAFLGIIDKPKKAIKEMKRVVKPGGSIASITSMALVNQAWHSGYYPEECKWYNRLCQLEVKVWDMYGRITPKEGYSKGIPSPEMPHFFSMQGLKNIRIYPTGKVFSLSNAAMEYDEKKEYIQGIYEANFERINFYYGLEEAKKYLSDAEYNEYIYLLAKKKDFLLSNIEENEIWEWEGGANLIVVGNVDFDK